MTVCWHPSQSSHNSLPKPSTIARCDRFQASSVGVRCQLMPASLPRFAPAVKPRGTVAIGVGRDYIWTMDETELTRRLGQPDNIIGREERMRSLGWVCSTCRNATANVVPMPCPAPCAWCGGIAFEMVDPPAQ